MKKYNTYKLKDLVTKGSLARRKVDSDVILGDLSAGYGYGDILDANAVVGMINDAISSQHLTDEEQDRLLQAVKVEIERQIQELELSVEAKVAAEVSDGDNLNLFATTVE